MTDIYYADWKTMEHFMVEAFIKYGVPAEDAFTIE